MRRTRLIVLAAVVVGLAARTYGIDRSLWLDEFSTLWCVEAGWKAVASRVASFQGQTPAYYYLVRASMDLFGESEVALRLPSLLASAATAVLCSATAGAMGGRPAALWAGVFSWLAFAQVQTGVNARPYALATLGLALATAGFVGATQSGRWSWRVAFVGGVCLAFWSHFVLALPVGGLLLAYLLTPALRQRYLPPRLLVDLLATAALVAPAWPYVAAAMTRPQHVRWLATAQHADILILLAPFALPWGLVATATRNREARPAERALLWSIAAVIALLEAAWFGGSNLVAARYLVPIVVAASVLAAVSMPRLDARDQVLAALVFLAITCGSYARTWWTIGSVSGMGVEDWRSTTIEARRHIHDTQTLVLFRSGFVEEDLQPLGRAHPATLSPLRSPGEPAFPGTVVALTNSWAVPGRERYFESALRPGMIGARQVLILAQRATDRDGNYTENLLAWCRTVYGNGMTVEALPSGRGIDLRLVRPASATR